jgi:hypothetical protein
VYGCAFYETEQHPAPNGKDAYRAGIQRAAKTELVTAN